MRWLHIISVITILGGFIYARYMVAPVLAALPAADADSFSHRFAVGFRNILYAAIGSVLLSGVYNYLTKPAVPKVYHMVIGIKFLLVLHVFAVSVLYTMPNTPAAKNARRMTGLVFSGIAIVLLSAVLRSLSLSALMK